MQLDRLDDIPLPDSIADSKTDTSQLLAYARDLKSLYQAARKQAQTLRLLVEVGKDLASASSVEALIRLALRRATELVDYGDPKIVLFGADQRVERIAGLDGNDNVVTKSAEDLPREVARTVRQKRPVMTPRRGKAGRQATERSGGETCDLYVPMLTPGGEVVGVLVMHNVRLHGGIGGVDAEAVQVLASQVAAALQSIRLKDQLRHNLDSLVALHAAGQVLNSSLGVEEVGRRVLEIAVGISGLSAAALRLAGPEFGEQTWRTPEAEANWIPLEQAPAACRARRRAVTAGGPVRFRARVVVAGVRDPAGWCLPLRSRHRSIGVLELYGPDGMVRAAPMELLASLANQTASALENTRLYAEIAKREKRLQDLVSRLFLAQEEERRRVAYEVHDGVAQVAAATHQHLQAFARRYRVRSPNARQELDRALQLAQRTVGEARRVIADLRPITLDDFGLGAAVRMQIEELRVSGYEVAYHENLGSRRLPAAVETGVYRMVQEALNNVRKHAQTSRVEVSLELQDQNILVQVRDWGRGFAAESIRDRGGPGERMGLLGMQQRAALLGGRCIVQSTPGSGTRVMMEIPLALRGGGSNDR